MKKSDKEFILKLVKKEVIVLTVAMEIKLKANLQREMNYFRIHLQHNINKTLMRITNNTINFSKLAFSMKHLANCLRIKITHLIFDNKLF